MKEIIMYRDQEITIFPDENPEKPDLWNDESFLVYDHRDLCIERKDFDPTEIFEHIESTKKWFYNGFYVFPVYAYIHSGIVLSVGSHNFPDARWDVFRGFCLVQRMKGMWERKKCFLIAESIIEEWNMYLSDDVWGYDSAFGGCCGYYGDAGKEQMILEAKAEIDYVLTQRQMEIDKLQLKLQFD